jgi:hypothetical protein
LPRRDGFLRTGSALPPRSGIGLEGSSLRTVMVRREFGFKPSRAAERAILGRVKTCLKVHKMYWPLA